MKNVRLPSFFKVLVLAVLAALPLAPFGARVADARIMVAAAGEPPAGGKGSIHIERQTRVNFTREMRDGGGFRWDIQYYGNVGQGTNYAYSSGVYAQVQGNNISSNGQGWMNGDGDEIEIGPYRIGSLNTYRRVKVYKDQPLARWIDIFENTTGSEQQVRLQVTSNMNYQLTGMTAGGGGATFGAKDWYFTTETQGGNNVPSLLHIVCDSRSKLRPQVMVQNNSINVTYVFTVPANGTAAICYFESQNNSMDAHKKTVAGFKPHKLLKDLSSASRKLLLNFAGSGVSLGDVDLERLDDGDQIIQANGDPLRGAVKNEQYVITTFYGKMTLPAKQVVGMVAGVTPDEPFRAVLTDGQIICGMPADEKLLLDLPTGGTLSVPLSKVSQWAYRVSNERPMDPSGSTSMMVLRTGDRLGFDPAAAKFSFRTAHGTIPLSGKELLEVSLDNPANAVHKATFINGSTLAGFLEPQKLDIKVKLGPQLSISRDLVSSIRFAPDEKPQPMLSQIILTNGDELWGELADQKLTIETEYNPSVEVKPANIKSLAFSQVNMGRVTAELFNGTVLRGQLTQQELSWQIIPGPTLKLPTCQLGTITRGASQPPAEVKEQVEKLVARLGAESYQDRQKATEELIKLGKSIAPFLQEHLGDSDPEVRQRIEDILEKFGVKANLEPQPPMIEPAALQLVD
jgi:hypothetical protein